MSFEQVLKEKINKSPFRSPERDILKVVLGDLQQKSATKKLTEDECHTIVKKIIKGNNESLGYLPVEDRRVKTLKEENEILTSLLPVYLTVQQIQEQFISGGVKQQICDAKSDGQAIGIAMKYLKGINVFVEGDTVKLAVNELRIK